ncbi:MAG: midcut-by-XrtH protein [Halioglobus sp.]
MKKITRMKISSLGLLLLNAVSNKVLAGDAGSIIYAPGALPAPPPPPIVAEVMQVPTLGGAALMVLSFILAVVAVRVIKSQKASGTNLIAIVTAATSLVVGAGGLSLVSSSVEATIAVIEMTEEDGGVLIIPIENEYYAVENNTAKPMTISGITVVNEDYCMVGEIDEQRDGGVIEPIPPTPAGSYVGECVVDMEIPPGDYCEIIISCYPV